MSRFKTILTAAAVAAGLLLSLSACKTLSQAPVIGVSTSDTIGMTQKIVDDLTAMAEADGYAIEVLNASGNYDAQELQINTLLEKPVSVLAICAVNPAELTRSLEAATAAEVPVVLFERPIEGTNAAFFAGYDAAEEGRTAAQAIAENDNGKANVVVEILGPSDNANASAASKGFHEVIDLIGNIKVVKVYSNWNADTAYEGMKSVLMRYPDITAIYNSNSTLDASISRALDTMGLNKKTDAAGHIFRVSVSGSKNGYLAAMEGYVDLLVVTDVGSLSAALYDALTALGSGKALEETSFIASSTNYPHDQVQSGQAAIWGFTSDIE